MPKVHIQTRINGEDVDFLCEPRQSLLEILREDLGLTGTKEGCSNGNCGACSVLLDGILVDSCLVLAVETAGREVSTIEGLATPSKLHPLQQKFLEHAALQCGILHRGSSWLPKRYWQKIPSRQSTRCVTGWPAIYAAVRDTIKLSGLSWMQPQ